LKKRPLRGDKIGGETPLGEQHKNTGDAKQAFLCGCGEFRRKKGGYRRDMSEKPPFLGDFWRKFGYTLFSKEKLSFFVSVQPCGYRLIVGAFESTKSLWIRTM
jgi:hypothetical protein